MLCKIFKEYILNKKSFISIQEIELFLFNNKRVNNMLNISYGFFHSFINNSSYFLKPLVI